MVKTTTIDKEHFDSVLLELIKVVSERQPKCYGKFTKQYYRVGKYFKDVRNFNQYTRTFSSWDYTEIVRKLGVYSNPPNFGTNLCTVENSNFHWEKWLGETLQTHDKDTWNSYLGFLKPHKYGYNTSSTKKEDIELNLYSTQFGIISFLLNPIQISDFKNSRHYGKDEEYMKNNYHTKYFRDTQARHLLEKTIDIPRKRLNFSLFLVKYPQNGKITNKGLSANVFYGNGEHSFNSHYKIGDLKVILYENKIPHKGVNKYMDLVNLIIKNLP